MDQVYEEDQEKEGRKEEKRGGGENPSQDPWFLAPTWIGSVAPSKLLSSSKPAQSELESKPDM